MDHGFYIDKIGSMVEELENAMRIQIEEIYLKKSREVLIYLIKQIVDTARFNPTEGKPNEENANKFKMIYMSK